jgi:hypothetical protein
MTVAFADDGDAKLKARIAAMTDAELIEFRKTVRALPVPKMASAFKNPFEEQLELAIDEWRRRHRKAE